MIRLDRLYAAIGSFFFFVAVVAPAQAVDMLYVSMSDNTVVRYDTTGNDGTTIAATKATFATTFINDPQGLTFDSSGNLYVSNIGNSTISKFNSSGVYQSIGSISTNLNQPSAIVFDTTGNLFAANVYTSTINKFNSSGGFAGSFGSYPILNNARGLAFDSLGYLYASNSAENNIVKFDSTGTAQLFISKLSGYLTNPNGIAFDTSGNFYVANYFNFTISKFSSSGTFLGNIGSTANLNQPQGIAFDTSGNLYATNITGTISKFDSSGNFLTSWSTGTTPRMLAFQPTIVPEPSAYALAAIAAGMIAIVARRQARRA
jgi:sugar lactone lactonase YvrE